MNSLSSVFGGQLSKEALAGAAAAAGLAPDVRGERLDLHQFAALADGLWTALSKKEAAEND